MTPIGHLKLKEYSTKPQWIFSISPHFQRDFAPQALDNYRDLNFHIMSRFWISNNFCWTAESTLDIQCGHSTSWLQWISRSKFGVSLSLQIWNGPFILNLEWAFSTNIATSFRIWMTAFNSFFNFSCSPSFEFFQNVQNFRNFQKLSKFQHLSKMLKNWFSGFCYASEASISGRFFNTASTYVLIRPRNLSWKKKWRKIC